MLKVLAVIVAVIVVVFAGLTWFSLSYTYADAGRNTNTDSCHDTHSDTGRYTDTNSCTNPKSDTSGAGPQPLDSYASSDW